MGRPGRLSRESWALYWRSYLLTLGIAFFSVGIRFWPRGADGQTQMLLGQSVMSGFLLIGITTICAGLFGPTHKMEAWAEKVSGHEACFMIMVVAFPVYVALSFICKRCKRKNNYIGSSRSD